MSILANAHSFRVDNMHIHSSQHVHSTQENQKEGWEMLLKHVASNALHDSSARFDPPKCDKDTRVEVTKELMDWIQDRESPQRLLCMTGAAGAGKSALQQTIAEQCSDSNILGSAFFFSAGDPTRNNLSRVIPTIACQLGLHNPALRDVIGKEIVDDQLIFEKNIKIQMNALVVTPFKRVSASGKLDCNTFPHAILIDGLDECSGEENQAELLSTIKHCLLDNDLPFRIFISSRPEWAIRSALYSKPEGYLYQLTYHIKLSDKYDATADIRHYLWRRLKDIGGRSHDLRAQSCLWPTNEDIEQLVAAASGQFVYAATVVKYVSERRGSPVDRLKKIIDWTPHDGQQTRPLEPLDTLYRLILSTAKELYEAVDTNRGRDFLLILRAHQVNSDRRIGFQTSTRLVDEIVGLEEGGHQVLFSDLHSLVSVRQDPKITRVWEEMHFYHLSFSEFLGSEFRAQHLFVSETRVRQYFVDSCLQKLRQQEDFLCNSSFSIIIMALLHYINNQTTHINDLRSLIDFTRNNGWRRLDERLSSHFKTGLFSFASSWNGLAHFTSHAIQRLNSDFHEHELAAIVTTYFDKWKASYQHCGFRLPEAEEEQNKEEKEREKEGN
ncbi:hypothetical protein EST38_g14082 [Candolleomyces aberdarensis]|uniref:Nephrocystin 3-like N-terminal domain-containing protein n=1 Tax=Candolleomyces aberdarensis TaxID=2316362 RepID=A0A4Q2CYC0_9AGAR|nr:hypothetical protein EST38_g14082 [Candolleomyces aberdarensis]